MKRLLLLGLIGLGSYYQSKAQVTDSTKVESAVSPTETNHKLVRLLLLGAMEFGGDDVATVYFNNGKSQTIKAGTGLLMAMGAELHFKKIDKLRIRASIGYKFDNVAAENASVRLSRIPLHLTANLMATENLRLGAGLVSHQAIKFNGDGIGESFKMNAASGPIFEIAYHGIGLSYTFMNYKDDMGTPYSANAFGITFSGVLPKRK